MARDVINIKMIFFPFILKFKLKYYNEAIESFHRKIVLKKNVHNEIN